MAEAARVPPPIEADREFRAALGAFATGVTVIAARTPDGQLHGLTVDSFAAVSLQSRSIPWSQSVRSPSHAAFATAPRFAASDGLS